MPTVTLKISDEDKTLWVESARCAGITLSEWIRRRCQGEPVMQEVAYLDRVAPLRATIGDPEGVSVHDPEVVRAALPRYPAMVKTDFKRGKKK